MPKLRESPPRSLMMSFLNKNLSLSYFGYTGESSSTANLSKEVKFVKAKELMVVAKNAEKVKLEKKNNVIHQRFMTKPPK